MVTSFTELNKFIRPLPAKLSTTRDVLRSLSRWKCIIKTDLKSAYYQVKVDIDSQQWLGTNSPFKGMFVYARGPMGLRNMAEYLEEMVSRVLGDLIAEGCVDKVADDLLIGGEGFFEVLENWTRVLKRLAENGLTLGADKTVICPKTIKILGWIWQSGGTIEVDTHRINPLTVSSLPVTVKQLRSFIGAFRAISSCIPRHGELLGKLEDEVAGKETNDKVVWKEDLVQNFKNAQEALKGPKSLTLPHPNDQLILISDACNSPPSVGSTLFVKRGDTLRVAGYFSAKIKKHQILWLPCEVEALGINLAVHAFGDVIRESKHTTKFLTDSKPCVQAFNKLSDGGFSLSPRLSSFLMNLNAHNVAIDHVQGSSIKLTDFVSRNPISCPDGSCQVCRFVAEQSEIAVRSINIGDIERGTVKMPFYNPAAWKRAQMQDPDLKRCFSQLMSGTRPGRKEKNLKDLRRYFQIASISDLGLLVYRKSNPYGNDFELIIVPKNLAVGVISALHIQLGHPTRAQLKKIWDKHFFALDSDRFIGDCTESCPLCTSFMKLPKEVFQHNTRPIPTKVGVLFSADVVRREGQKIFVLIDIFSLFMLAQIIPDEKGTTLQEMLVHLSANYKHPDGCTIRVDTAPGFGTLKDDKFLLSIGITLDFGRVKSKNQNPSIDRAIQDLEREVTRLAPKAGKISLSKLAMAVANTNCRVRNNGLSSREILTKRDNFTSAPLNFEDSKISAMRYEERLRNHQSSMKSKCKNAVMATSAPVAVGDIVHIKIDGTKHRTRDFYLVISIDNVSRVVVLQKFCGNKLMQKQYQVTPEEIYLAATNYGSKSERISDDRICEDDDGGLHLRHELDQKSIAPDFTQDDYNGQALLRRSTRERHPPNYLATEEIHRLDWSREGRET